MSLRFFVASLCLAGTALLAGCGSAVGIATEARESALAVEDAYDGYSLLVDAADNRPFWFFERGNAFSDAQRQAWTIMEQTADDLIMKAIQQGNEKLLLPAIGNPARISEVLQPSIEAKTHAIALLLEQLEKDESAISSEMLVLLSDQVRQGEYVVQNYKRAVRIAEIAWQRGYPEAARQLTQIYNSANDVENAYFWGLRCIGECRGLLHRQDLGVITRELSAGDIQRIQAAATDSSKLRVTF